MIGQLLFQIILALVILIVAGQNQVNFALHKNANQSTTLNYEGFNWTADKAVDGNHMTCSATTQTPIDNHTWEVDLGLQIIVKTITVYGRQDVTDQIDGVKLYLGNTSGPWNYSDAFTSYATGTTPNTKYVFTPGNVIAHYVSLMRYGRILTICEVTVEGDCIPGTYGSRCSETCGNCYKGNNSCSLTDGRCMEGCEAGWRHYQCKTECDNGTYGYNCNGTCGNCLNGNISCFKSNGICRNGCDAGWQGDHCKKGCELGKFSYSCNETCGYCLHGNISCSTSNGRCSNGCDVGWQGDDCKQGSKQAVDKISQQDGETNVLGGAVGGAVAALVLIAVIVIVIFVFRRKRKRNNNEKRAEMTHAPNYANLVVENTDDNCKVTVYSTAKTATTGSSSHDTSRTRIVPTGTNHNHLGVMQDGDHVNTNYEKLHDRTESKELAYSSIDQAFVHQQEMKSLENCSSYMQSLQSLEGALRSVEEEITVVLDKKEKLLSRELERARGDKIRDKRMVKDSTLPDKDKDFTIHDYVQTSQSLEEELRNLEEKKTNLLERKEFILRQELAKTTKSGK